MLLNNASLFLVLPPSLFAPAVSACSLPVSKDVTWHFNNVPYTSLQIVLCTQSYVSQSWHHCCIPADGAAYSVVLSAGLRKKNSQIFVDKHLGAQFFFFCIYFYSLREERKLRVSENMVLRRIFGVRRNVVTGEWRRLHNEELNDLYPSPNIVRMINSRRMWWVGHVARMGEERSCIGSWWGNRKDRDHWADVGVDGWIILWWISRRWDVGKWTGLDWPRIETDGGRLWVR